MVFDLVKTGAKAQGESWRDNYRTPEELLSLVRDCLGQDYFDPCPANPDFDGLSIKWQRNSFINPPFSKYPQWVLYGLEQPWQQIWLANNATETKWFQLLAKKSQGLCLLRPKGLFNLSRVPFIDPRTKLPAKDNVRGQVLFYRGGDLERFQKVFGKHGVITMPIGG